MQKPGMVCMSLCHLHFHLVTKLLVFSFSFVVLLIKPRASYTLGEQSAIKLHPLIVMSELPVQCEILPQKNKVESGCLGG